MSHDLERWQPLAGDDSTELDTIDDNEVIDVQWSPVEDDSDDYMPTDDNSGDGWGGSWLQQRDSEADSTPVTYAEPEVVDTPFTFLQPDDAALPVKRSGWGGGWFSSDSNDLDTLETDSSEIERYTSAHFESEPATEQAYWQPIGERDALPSDTGATPFADWWAHTTAATSQATDVMTDVATDAAKDTRKGSQQSNRTGNRTRSNTRPEPREDTYSPPKGNNPTSTPTTFADGGQTSATMQSGGASTKDWGWYYIAQDDPREDADIHRLRHFYFLYEFGDGNEEWPEADFHKWVQSLDNGQYQLYVEAGQVIMDNALVDNMKDGALKTAYMSMRLEGDSPDSERNDIIGRVSAAFLRGFSR